QHLTLCSAADLPLSDFSVAGSKSNPYRHALREVYEKDTLNPDDLVCVLESPVPTCKFADEMDMSTLEFGDQSGRP
ncbi:hypothetical protein PR001_g16224, partial [Phytophthora rubi]